MITEATLDKIFMQVKESYYDTEKEYYNKLKKDYENQKLEEVDCYYIRGMVKDILVRFNGDQKRTQKVKGVIISIGKKNSKTDWHVSEEYDGCLMKNYFGPFKANEEKYLFLLLNKYFNVIRKDDEQLIFLTLK